MKIDLRDGSKFLAPGAADTWVLHDEHGPMRPLNVYENRMVQAAYAAPSPNTVDLLEEIAQLQSKGRAIAHDLVAAEETIKQLGERNEKLVVCYTHRTDERDEARKMAAQFDEGLAILKAKAHVVSRPENFEYCAVDYGYARGVRAALALMTRVEAPILATPEEWRHDTVRRAAARAYFWSWARVGGLWGMIGVTAWAIWGLR